MAATLLAASIAALACGSLAGGILWWMIGGLDDRARPLCIGTFAVTSTVMFLALLAA